MAFSASLRALGGVMRPSRRRPPWAMAVVRTGQGLAGIKASVLAGLFFLIYWVSDHHYDVQNSSPNSSRYFLHHGVRVVPPSRERVRAQPRHLVSCTTTCTPWAGDGSSCLHDRRSRFISPHLWLVFISTRPLPLPPVLFHRRTPLRAVFCLFLFGPRRTPGPAAKDPPHRRAPLAFQTPQVQICASPDSHVEAADVA